MEVKMFVADRPEIVEADVNAWLKDSGAKILYVGQSQSERNGKFVFVMSVFYANN